MDFHVYPVQNLASVMITRAPAGAPSHSPYSIHTIEEWNAEAGKGKKIVKQTSHDCYHSPRRLQGAERQGEHGPFFSSEQLRQANIVRHEGREDANDTTSPQDTKDEEVNHTSILR